MSRSDPQVNFRIPSELKRKLEEASSRNRRSITAELIARLEWSFADEESLFASLQNNPPAEDDDEQITNFDSPSDPRQNIRVRGVSKQLLLKSIENSGKDSSISRSDLSELISMAVARALDSIGAEPTDNAGPKPRKRYPKE